MIKLWLLCMVSLLFGCGYNSFSEPESPPPETKVHNMDIASARALCKDRPLVIYDKISFSGYVTANDKSNNFYRTVVIQDNNGALEIKAGLQDMHNIYHLGQRVVIEACDLTVGISLEGLLQIGIGRVGWEGLHVDYFGHRTALDKYIRRDTKFDFIEPINMQIYALNETMCGMLVRIDNLMLLPEEPPFWGYVDGNVFSSQHYRHFVDRQGGEIVVVTSSYANFAQQAIPSGEISLVGVLLYGKAGSGKPVYMLRLRDAEDII